MQFRFPGQSVDYNVLPQVALCHPITSMMLILSVHAVIQGYLEIYLQKCKVVWFFVGFLKVFAR